MNANLELRREVHHVKKSLPIRVSLCEVGAKRLVGRETVAGVLGTNVCMLAGKSMYFLDDRM